MELLPKSHRFFVSQLLYPIVLSSLLAVSIYTGRVLLTQNWIVYRNLVWNLFLAWVPYFFSIVVAALFQLSPQKWWRLLLPGFLWLAFFPNAPYIVTDFLHLEHRPGIPLWYDIGLLATFAWTGIFLAIASLRTMQKIVQYYLGTFISWIFALAALSLGGLGIYLGRFSRWNSWDLLLNPEHIMSEVAYRLVNPFNDLRFIGFTMMFTAFLLVCYLMFVSAHRIGGSHYD